MRIVRLFYLVLMLCTPLARGAAFKYEFLVLPSAQAVGTFDRRGPNSQLHDEVIQADTLFTLQQGPFKLFGEYLLSDHEGDLERLQLGWQMSDDTIVWIGRFHQPTSVWNHDHHHGQYLQTSITRPAIDEWEDLGGIVPQHFTGALLESGHAVFGSWKLRTALAGGLAPEITPAGLEPFDVIRPGQQSRHRLGYQARVSLHPEDLTETGGGLLLANDTLAAVGLSAGPLPGLDHIVLRLVGLFATYAGPEWKVTATINNADTRLYFAGSRKDDSFIVGYVQAERHLGYDLTGFVRWEDSSGAQRSTYLHLFEQFARTRGVFGLRWDFMEHQALSVQFAKSHTLAGRYNDIRLQWSAALF